MYIAGIIPGHVADTPSAPMKGLPNTTNNPVTLNLGHWGWLHVVTDFHDCHTPDMSNRYHYIKSLQQENAIIYKLYLWVCCVFVHWDKKGLQKTETVGLISDTGDGG